MKTFFLPILGIILTGAFINASAANIGSKAPKLQIEHWVKGAPVDINKANEKKKQKIHTKKRKANCGKRKNERPSLKQNANGRRRIQQDLPE